MKYAVRISAALLLACLALPQASQAGVIVNPVCIPYSSYTRAVPTVTGNPSDGCSCETVTGTLYAHVASNIKCPAPPNGVGTSSSGGSGTGSTCPAGEVWYSNFKGTGTGECAAPVTCNNGSVSTTTDSCSCASGQLLFTGINGGTCETPIACNAPGVFGQTTNTCTCPANSSYSGGNCVCASGYTMQNGSCVKTQAGNVYTLSFSYNFTATENPTGTYGQINAQNGVATATNVTHGSSASANIESVGIGYSGNVITDLSSNPNAVSSKVCSTLSGMVATNGYAWWLSQIGMPKYNVASSGTSGAQGVISWSVSGSSNSIPFNCTFPPSGFMY